MPIEAVAPRPDPLAPALSEDALAAAFVQAYGSTWRYVADWGCWRFWTGTHWARDEVGAVRELIRQVCRSAAVAHDKPGEARRIASDRTIRAVERIATADPAMAARPSDWDTSPMELNTPAGLVDLATGEIRPHDSSMLVTRLTGASPGTGCPKFMAFLDQITGSDARLVAYLARFFGYCLTGSTREQVFVFLEGPGANGKSVLLQTIAAVMGDYAATAPLETFMASQSDRHSTDLAGLQGARLVLVPEVEAGRAWSEARIKTITGGEEIKARFMHRDFFPFRPQFKLAVAGNHRPSLARVGEAMRRRLHLVPLTVTIPPEQRDRQLPEKLRAERDGILGWMLAGCAEWQLMGLAPPPAVSSAVEDYFAAEDVFGQWVAEECRTGPPLSATAKHLYGSWSIWAKARGHEVGSTKTLGELLRERGLAPKKIGRDRGWSGIAPDRRASSGEDVS
ncbi:phage/plasmid primase, P4 family [Rubellimicrobium arenae]|uniref:phage/plasmid primase, P4 family n=1 Tax=Rubellimicrobium arenae TaxID=2817372 RepID=UPI001B314B48|nr:phage/plasmid primase, P4 family [Rubellimicrobium arenae]